MPSAYLKIELSKVRLFQVFIITALLIAGIPNLATAAVGAKSLRGLFSPDECELVPELLGAWTSLGVTYSVRESHHNRYWVLDRDADLSTGKKLVLEICAAHIDGKLFYDATFQILGPGNESTLPPEFIVGEGFAVNIVAGFWVPMHIIGKLEIEQNKIYFRNIDNEWLQGALKSRLITVPSVQDDFDEYLLTANGKQLKVFVASLATNPKAFSEQLDLARIPERTPNGTP
jgi:hypothetical protein